MASMEEKQWMSDIREMVEQILCEDGEAVESSIFEVPMSVRSKHPDCYTPLVVCMGPYHHHRNLEMERSKAVLAKRTQSHLLESGRFESVVDELRLVDSKVRGCYDKHLGLSKEMLSWMMALDGAFLLDFLSQFLGGTNPNNGMMIRDVAMLENQIPLLVLRRMSPETQLEQMLVGLCEHLSPFKMELALASESSPHLLDFLYRVVVQEVQQVEEEEELVIIELEEEEEERVPSVLRWMLLKIVLPFMVYCHLPALALVKDSCLQFRLERPVPTRTAVQEIKIPSVVELWDSGVVFVASEGGISSISFDRTTRELRLPVVRLDVNSEAVLRNLVAYEAARCGPLWLARYTELMNGIVDSEEDARLLRERGVILNRLNSDREVARIWNSIGIYNSPTLSKVPHLDRVIQHVNAYYNATWRFRFRNFMHRYVYSSWQLLTFLAAFLFLFFFITLQVFSSLFNSPTRNYA